MNARIEAWKAFKRRLDDQKAFKRWLDDQELRKVARDSALYGQGFMDQHGNRIPLDRVQLERKP